MYKTPKKKKKKKKKKKIPHPTSSISTYNLSRVSFCTEPRGYARTHGILRSSRPDCRLRIIHLHASVGKATRMQPSDKHPQGRTKPETSRPQTFLSRFVDPANNQSAANEEHRECSPSIRFRRKRTPRDKEPPRPQVLLHLLRSFHLGPYCTDTLLIGRHAGYEFLLGPPCCLTTTFHPQNKILVSGLACRCTSPHPQSNPTFLYMHLLEAKQAPVFSFLYFFCFFLARHLS